MKKLRKLALWLGTKLLRFAGVTLPSAEVLEATRKMVEAADKTLAGHTDPYKHAKVYAALRLRFPKERESVLTQAIGISCQ